MSDKSLADALLQRSVIAVFVAVVTLATLVAQEPSATATAANPDRSARPPANSEHKSLSPDEKWEFSLDRDDNGRLIRTGTTDTAVELSLPCGPATGTCHEPIWSPDSKRFAFNYGQGRTRECTFYQLSGDEWKELEASDSSDPLNDLLGKRIAAQVKKKGLPATTDLRLISDTLKAHHWIDSNTLVVFASLGEVVREDMEIGFSAAYLGTVKFDPTGAWKLIKTRELSEKEAEKYRSQ
jgi:hypothetical protein